MLRPLAANLQMGFAKFGRCKMHGPLEYVVLRSADYARSWDADLMFFCVCVFSVTLLNDESDAMLSH